jgi:glycosyltransferase involved in cell wall biosynthesis
MKAESDKQNIIIESPKLEQLSSGLSALSIKIGFDGKRAANNLTGLGNYSRSLIEQLANLFPNNIYNVYTPKVKSGRQIDNFFKNKNVHLKLPQSEKILWRSFGIVKDLMQDNIDIYHGLSHEIPFNIQKTNIKSVVTMHDLIFLRFPQYYKFIDRFLYRLKSKYACKNADKIIAISQKTKDDIVEFYNIDANKIDVIYQSCDDSFKIPLEKSRLEEIKSKYNLPEKYLLNVGTIESRKNLKLIVKVLKNINPEYKLIAIGKKTPYYKEVLEEIEKQNLSSRILFLKDIPFADLPGIYQMAKVFVYPSFYEGFGIPIIEALYSGVPVIAATGSCLEEAGGPNSLYVNPNDDKALADAINSVLSNNDLQNEMKIKGIEFVQKFNTAIVSQQLINVYQKLVQTL